MEHPVIIATRGSALALAQANFIASQCREFFPHLRFELKIIKTTGDKMQKSSLVQGALPKGLFTKELEVALAKGEADLAVHSLKDLPTELPAGLIMAATPKRADVRDVLVYRSGEYFKPRPDGKDADRPVGQKDQRGFLPGGELRDFPKDATIATSSIRRKVQLSAVRPDLKVVEIRGNVATRLQKIANGTELNGTVLALAGLTRLNFKITPDGKLVGNTVPDGLLATVLDLDIMLPCVGQAAIGVEIRADDQRIARICERLNHYDTFQCTTAERAFLSAMGGGCQSPLAAYAEVTGDKISMRARSFAPGIVGRVEMQSPLEEAVLLGKRAAAELRQLAAS